MLIQSKINDKILILGARGNLGSQLMRVLGNDYRLICWDREDIDVTDRELIIKKIVELKPNYIINATAYNAVDNCEEDEKQFELASKLNGSAVGHIADGAIKVNAVLIHFSTDYVFGGVSEEEMEKAKQNKGFAEEDEPRPINKYAETKLMGEREVITRSGKALKWYLIRTSKLFGPGGDSEFSKPGFFDIMLKLSKEKSELDVVDEEISCFTYTIDLANATKELIESDHGSGIYHIINDGAVTWYAAAKELFKISKINIKLNPVSGDKFPRPAKRPDYSVLKNTKFRKLRNYREALKDYIVKSS